MLIRYCIRGAIAALLLNLGLSGVNALAAQTGAVTGVITDAVSGQPLFEVSVDLVGTVKGMLTDADGRYLLDGVPEGAYTVRTRMIGYGIRTAEVKVKAGSTAVADFQLEVDFIGAGGLVTACPPRRPECKTGVSLPVIDVDGRLAETFPPGDFSRILEGRIPGVRSIGTSGGIGAGRELRIRGTDSFGYTRQRPLVLVDGVRIDTNKEEWGDMEGVACCFFSGGAGEDRLSDFNPEEIDRVEVLKGPAAAALFGAEGAAGVIKVFTTQGRTNTPASFTLNAGLGVNRLRANLPTRMRPELSGPDGSPALDPNEHLIEDGLVNNYDLTVRGGSEGVTYFAAGGFAYEEGSVKPNDRRRANLRVNVNWAASDNLLVAVASGLVRNRIWSLQSGNSWLGVYSNAMGSDPREATGEEPYGGGLSRSVSVADANAIRTVSDTDRWTGRVQLAYASGADLNHRLTFGADRVSEQKTRDLPPGRYYTNVGDEGEKNDGHRESRKYTLDFLSTYDYGDDFGRGFLSGSLSVGGQLYWDDMSATMVTGRGFAEGSPMSIAAARETFADDTAYDEHSRGVFVLNRLDFGDDLSLTAAVRVDRHSAFGDSVGAQVYPKANVAYTVPESMLPAAISGLRFRAAYGLAGKPPPRSTERRVFDQGSRDSVTVPANWNLAPENKREVEAGIDFGLLNDRIGVELTYYDARVLNGLFPREAADPVVHSRAENSIEITGYGAGSHSWTVSPVSYGVAQPRHMGSVFNRLEIGGGLRLAFQLRGEMGAVMYNRERWYGVRQRIYDEYLVHLDEDGRPTLQADSVLDYHSLVPVDKRDHVRLQDVSLSYMVPKDMAGKLGLGRTTVTVSGYNLHWWDDCNCQDPNAKHDAADTGTVSTRVFMALPQPRRFLVSVRTRF